jgi:thiamine kinase-like enzyme
MQLVATHDPALVPPVIAADRALATVLLADVEGEDQWEAPPRRLIEMVQRWVRVQAAWADQVDELLDAGLPDWRSIAFNAAAESFVGRPDVRTTLSRPELARLDRLVQDLPERLRALSACGLPDTLVHGDFHPGNWVSDGTSLVLLDWGDSGVGSPMLDAAAFLARPAPDVRDRLRAAWIDAWRQERSQTDPARAEALIRPVAALRQALIYQQFLDGIEPSEHRYHDQDVPHWLRQAIIDTDSKPA